MKELGTAARTGAPAARTPSSRLLAVGYKATPRARQGRLLGAQPRILPSPYRQQKRLKSRSDNQSIMFRMTWCGSCSKFDQYAGLCIDHQTLGTAVRLNRGASEEVTDEDILVLCYRSWWHDHTATGTDTSEESVTNETGRDRASFLFGRGARRQIHSYLVA